MRACANTIRQAVGELDLCIGWALWRVQLGNPVGTLPFNSESTLLHMLDGGLAAC